MNFEPRTRLVLWLALGVALLTALSDIPARWSRVEAILPVTLLWPDLDAQYRAQLQIVPYDLLRAADAVVPREAVLLLVTSGRDVTRSEYTTYHRALYFLAPRQVWWLSPAAPDGTWKSRWWTSTPLTTEDIRREAARRGASYILVHDVAEPLDLGTRVASVGEGYVTSLTAEAPQVRRAEWGVRSGEWVWRIVAAVATILLIGSAIVAIVRRLGYSPGRLEGLGLAWSLGAGVTSVLMLWLNTIGFHLQWQIATITFLAAGWAVWSLRAWLVAKRDSGTRSSPTTIAYVAQPVEKGPGWTKYVRAILALALVAQIALISVTAVGRPLEVWDSWVNWSMKARTIFLDGYISPSVYADPSRAVAHLDYPLLAPLVQSWFYGWLDAPDDRFAGVASVLFYLALLTVCFAALTGGGAGKTMALAATTVIATMAYLTGLAALVFAEMPLTLYCAIAGVYMAKWLSGGSLGALAVASIAAGLMPWTKKEGIVLLIVMGAAVLLLNPKRRRAWSRVGAMLLAAGLIAGPWWFFVAYNGIASSDFLPVTVETLGSNLGRVGTIAQLGFNSLSGSGLSYIWPLTAAAGIVVCWLQRGKVGKRAEDFLPLAAFLFVFVMALSYLFSAFVPYTDHILSSIDRLILPVTPLIVIWLVLRAHAPVWSKKHTRANHLPTFPNLKSKI